MQAERQSKSILAEEWAGKVKNMNKLRTFLCDAARVKGSTEVRVDTCRSCESQCAYGREYVKRWDAGERPMRPGPKPKPKTEEPVEAADKPVTVQPAETARLERELEDLKGREKADQDVIKQLREQLTDMEAKLIEARSQNEADSELIQSARVQLETSNKALKSQETELLKMRETNRLLSDDVKRMTLETEEKEQLNSDLRQTVASLMEAKKAAQQESQQLREANRTMVLEVKTMSAELAETRQELDRRCEQLHKLIQEHNECKITNWRLKARLYDMEHPEEE